MKIWVSNIPTVYKKILAYLSFFGIFGLGDVSENFTKCSFFFDIDQLLIHVFAI